MQLEGEGLVDIEPRRGAVVRSFASADLIDLYEIRALLEPAAAARAALRVEREQLDRLRGARGALGRARRATTRAIDDQIAWNEEFHAHRDRGRGQPAAARRRCAPRPASRAAFRTAFWRDEAQRAFSQTCHRELVSALAARSAERAEAVMRMHILRRERRSCVRMATTTWLTRRSPACARSSSASCSPGPFVGTLLGDFGADVIKVEAPAERRPDARLGPPAPQRPLALVVDPRAQQALGRAQPARARGPGDRRASSARRADVVLENFRPGHDGEVGARPRATCTRATRGCDLRARVRLRADRPLPRPRRASRRPARRSAACATSTATPARRRRAAASRSATRSPRSRPSRASCSRSYARDARGATGPGRRRERSPTPASR